jgi:hypothetical protein
MNSVIDQMHEFVAVKWQDAEKVIPVITEPLGKHWDQPKLSEIKISDNEALMSVETFKKLADYSSSRPTGVYHGKMWKGEYWTDDKKELAYYLRWFGISDQPSMCSNHYRLIILL